MTLKTSQIVRYDIEEYVKPVPAPASIPTPEPVPATAGRTPQELLDDAAALHGLQPEFVRSVASVESAFKVNALSPKGAIGLMQLMPGTAADLGVDAKDPKQNAEAGTRYLRQLLEKYKDHPDGLRLALAAYNAGPGAVDKYKRNVPPYRETQAYVEKVVRRYLEQLKLKNAS
jgi:soluble lytic murein transglycosylase-like protein